MATCDSKASRCACTPRLSHPQRNSWPLNKMAMRRRAERRAALGGAGAGSGGGDAGQLAVGRGGATALDTFATQCLDALHSKCSACKPRQENVPSHCARVHITPGVGPQPYETFPMQAWRDWPGRRICCRRQSHVAVESWRIRDGVG